jgi:hypothetical protein
MTKPTPDQGSAAAVGDVKPTPVLINADRLRAHLEPESLASALLNAWLAAGGTDAQTRMLDALEKHHQSKRGTNGRATSSKD